MVGARRQQVVGTPTVPPTSPLILLIAGTIPPHASTCRRSRIRRPHTGPIRHFESLVDGLRMGASGPLLLLLATAS